MDLLDGDFYRFEALLGTGECETLHAVREFLRAEVVPIANHYWSRAEFPFGVMPRIAAPGIVGNASRCGRCRTRT